MRRLKLYSLESVDFNSELFDSKKAAILYRDKLIEEYNEDIKNYSFKMKELTPKDFLD